MGGEFYSMEDERDRWQARAERAEARVKELEDPLHHNRQDTLRLQVAEARITQLEADLAAARTVQVHTLVADAMEKALRGDAHDTGLWMAVAKLRLAGITIQPVRTYTREEAEAKWYEIEARHERYPGFGWDSFREEIVSALMQVQNAGVPKVHVTVRPDDVQRLLDEALTYPPSRCNESIDAIIRAVRLINAKVDSLAKRT